MIEVLTYDEMRTRFNGEWVLVEDPEVDAQMRVVRGKVISHAVSRVDVDKRMLELRPAHSAALCFRKRSPDSVLIL